VRVKKDAARMSGSAANIATLNATLSLRIRVLLEIWRQLITMARRLSQIANGATGD
jgi:hypothetical protein